MFDIHKYIFISTYTNHYSILYFYGIQIYYHQYFQKILRLDILMLILLIPYFLHSVWLYGKFVSASCQQLKQLCILAFAHFAFFSNFDRTSSCWFWTLLSMKSKEVMFSNEWNDSVYKVDILVLPRVLRLWRIVRKYTLFLGITIPDSSYT